MTLRRLAHIASCALGLALTFAPGATQAAGVRLAFAPTAIAFDFPILTPGTETAGSWATTPTPAAQGDGTAYGGSEPAIAGWDTPEFIEVNRAVASSTADQAALATPVQKVCVDAFTTNSAGVQKVSFSLNGSVPVDVLTPIVTPEAGDLEYCAYIDVATFGNADVPWELRAIVYPVNGVPLVMQGGGFGLTGPAMTNKSALWGFAAGATGVGPVYYVTPGGSATACGSVTAPCPTVQAVYNSTATAAELGGATICLTTPSPQSSPQVVTSGNDPTKHYETYRHVNIRTCGGTSNKANTFVSSTDTGRQHKVRFRDLTFSGIVPPIASLNGTYGYLWADNVDGVGTGLAGTAVASAKPFSAANENVYVTGGAYSNYADGFIQLSLVRGSSVTNIGSDLFQYTRMVVNTVGSYNYARSLSGPYTVTEVIDSTHVRIAKTTALVDGDCLTGTGLTAACNVSITHKISGPPDQSDTTSNGGAGSTVLTLSAAATATPTTFSQRSAAHPDIHQLLSATDGLIDYNTIAKDHVTGQGLVWPATVTNSAIVNGDWNDPNNSVEAVMNISGANNKNNLIMNMLFASGVRTYVGTNGIDTVVRNSVCAGNRTIPYSGTSIQFDNSPTCNR